MPAVGTAIAGAASAIGSAFGATGIFAKGTVLGFLARTAASIALSALANALARRGAPKPPGIKTEATTSGGTEPQSIILGRYATAGHHAAPPYSGQHLVYVIDIADMPITAVNRVIINEEYVEWEPSPSGNLLEHRITGDSKYVSSNPGAIVANFYDGTQTEADPFLLDRFGSHPTRPWASDMVGTGVAYAVMRFRHRREVFSGLPRVRFEVDGAALYDPREDSTVGGDGPQRWDDPATWQFTRNPAVMIYNIFRGITLPDGTVWGYEFGADDLPLSNWFAAMNECDVPIDLDGGGTEPQYRAGIEVKIGPEDLGGDAPADIVEELLNSCSAEIAEIGGTVKIRVGAPTLPVLFITDDDIVVTSPDDYAPFPGLHETHNGVTATHPSPEALWEPVDAPPRYNADFEAEDADRRLVGDITLNAVTSETQVQRLMRAWIEDERRWRRHNITLSPRAAILEPLDTFEWTSERNGYVDKLFEARGVTHTQTLNQAIACRERDPSDYDWSTDFELPVVLSDPASPLDDPDVPANWSAFATVIKDGAGGDRRPAIRLIWTQGENTDATALEWELRIAGQTDLAAQGTTSDVALGEVIVSEGVLPGESYEARGRFVADRPMDWTAWASVSTPDVRLGEVDFADAFNTRVDDLRTDADKALADSDQAIADASSVQAQLDEIEIDIATAEQVVSDAEAIRDDTQSFKDASEAAKTASELARDNAQTSATNADGSASSAAGSAQTAETKATEAGESATSAQAFSVSAEAAKDDAESAAGASSNFAQAASASADDASEDATATLGWRNEAQTASSDAQTFRDESATSASNADSSASTASTQAGIATSAATDAGDSASAAATSESNAFSFAGDAEQEAGAAQQERIDAETARGGSEAARDIAVTAKEDAEDFATSASTSLELLSKMDGGSLIPNGYFDSGDFSLWEGSAISTGTAMIEERGSGVSSAMNPSPTRFVARINSDSSNREIRSPAIQVRGGEDFRRRVLYSSGGSGDAVEFQIRTNWLDEEDSFITSTLDTISVSSIQPWQEHTRDFTAPSNAARATMIIRRLGGAGRLLFVTSIEFERRDPDALDAQATASQALSTAVDAETAFASFESEVSAEFGGLSAFIEDTRVAVTDIDGFQAAFAGITVDTSGGSIAGFRATSFSDPDGSSGSILELLGDQVILPGSLSVGTLVIHDGSGNIANDGGTFRSGDQRGPWTFSNPDLEVIARGSSGDSAVQNAPTPFLLSTPTNYDSTGDRYIVADNVPVKAGDEFAWSMDIASGGVSRNVRWQLIFRRTNLDGSQTASFNSESTGSTGWSTREGSQAQSEDGNVRIELRRSGSDQTGRGYVTNVEVRKKRSGATVITPGGITADLVDAGSFNVSGLAVFGGELRSDNFSPGSAGWQITESGAEFGTLELREGSVSDTRFSSGDNSGGIVTSLSFTADAAGSQEFVLLISGEGYASMSSQDSAFSSDSSYRVIVNGNVVRQRIVVQAIGDLVQRGVMSDAIRFSANSGTIEVEDISTSGDVFGSDARIDNAQITLLELKR